MTTPFKRLLAASAASGATMLAALVALTTPTPAPAHGTADAQTVSVMVRHIDRTPDSPAEARQLYRRLGDAALKACGATTASLVDVRRAVRQSPCWKDAMTRAVGEIQSPVLAELLHGARAGAAG